MSENTSVKKKLIKLFGSECFIEKLHLRIDEKPRKYKSKNQKKRMKKLSYHHILRKADGGQATVENGALLSVENHEWFHRQPKANQDKMNRLFQEYKTCALELIDDLKLPSKTTTQELVITKKSNESEMIRNGRRNRC